MKHFEEKQRIIEQNPELELCNNRLCMCRKWTTNSVPKRPKQASPLALQESREVRDFMEKRRRG